jgi:hypothetical protein
VCGGITSLISGFPFRNLAGVFETGEGNFTSNNCIGFEITAVMTMIRIRIYL